MIIKKKYTNLNKQEENKVELVEKSQDVSVPDSSEGVNKELKKDVSENIVSTDVMENDKNTESTQQEVIKVKNPDLDLTISNITFEPREERREGTRRRGYRRSQDRNLVSRAQKDAESIKEAAKKEGYDKGIELAQADLENLRNKFAEFYNYKDEVFEKVSECIIDISLEIAKKVINREVERDSEYLLPMIKGVVEEVNKTENKITLKVMPKDVEILKDNIVEIFEGNYFEAKVSVIPDATIKDGGVIVETSNGLIDASIETQLSIIEKALKKQEDS